MRVKCIPFEIWSLLPQFTLSYSWADIRLTTEPLNTPTLLHTIVK